MNLRKDFDNILNKYGTDITIVNIHENPCPVCGTNDIKGCDACYGMGKQTSEQTVRARYHSASVSPMNEVGVVSLKSVGEIQTIPLVVYVKQDTVIKENDFVICDGIIYEVHLIFKERLLDGRPEFIWMACEKKPTKQTYVK